MKADEAMSKEARGQGSKGANPRPPTARTSHLLDPTRWLLFGLLVLAAAVRAYWGTRQRVVWGDEPYYLWLGQSLLSGQGYQFFGISGTHFSPLFPVLAALIGRLAGNSTQALAAGSVALYVVCGALLVLPIYAMTRRLAGRAAGLIAGLTAALYPTLTAGLPLWGTMTEPLYLLLVATAWWGLLVAQQDRRLSGHAVAGVALGLAYLTRTEALIYLIAGTGALLLINTFIPDRSRGRAAGIRQTLAGILLAMAVFGLIISPYLIAMRVKTGQWQLAEEAGSTYVSAAGLARGDVAAFDMATWGLDPASGQVYLFSPTSEGEGLLPAIAADPRGFVRRLRGNLADVLATALSAQLVPLVLAALAVLGLFARAWDARRLRGELLLLASLAGPLSFLPFFIQPRYLVGVLIPVTVWIGEGVAWLGEWLDATWERLRHGDMGVNAPGSVGELQNGGVDASVLSHTHTHNPPHLRTVLRALPALLLAVALLWLQPGMWARSQRTQSFQPGHTAIAAELRGLGVPADTVVMSRYPAIAFHAGTRWTPTPAADWQDVEAYARRQGARYLVVDEWETQLRPQLRALLDPAQAPPELEYVTTEDRGAGPVVLYRFR